MSDVSRFLFAGVIAAVVAVVVVFATAPGSSHVDAPIGADGDSNFTNLVASGDATIGGDLTVTTSNSATSTVYAGCYQLTASSTASPVKLVLGKVNSTATTTLYGDTSIAAVYAAYGTCP